MEHDDIGHTTTANLATHTGTHTPRGRPSSSRWPISSSSSLLREPATPTSPSTPQIELHRKRRNPHRPMPTIGHTRQGQTTPALDDELQKGDMLVLRRSRTLQSHRWPVIVATWIRSTAAPTPRQHSEQRTVGHAGKIRLPKPSRDPTSARRTTFAKLHPWTLHSR